MSEQHLALSSALDQATALAQGEISARELLEVVLARNDRYGPDLNAIVTLDTEKARSRAAAVDERRASGDAGLGPLAGVPFTIKDAIATAGVRTTGGAVELADHVPTEDAPAVRSLHETDGVFFGKTNLPRWSGDVQAFNEIFGVTNNPWDLLRGPGGSSGGAAAAVAAGLTGFELGTDIGGSVRLPAHFCGICGHKPSYGVIPQRGYVDHASATETAAIGYGGHDREPDVNVFGPLARSVADLEVLVAAMAGPTDDRAVAWRLALPPPRHPEARALRVAAWFDDPVCPVSDAVGSGLEQLNVALRAAGVRVDHEARPGVGLSEVWEVGLPLVSAATTPARTTEEFARQMATADDDSLPRSMRMRAEASAIRHRDWLLLNERRDRARRAWAEFFTRFDVLLCPVSFTTAFAHVHDGTLYSRTLSVDGVERPYADLIAWTSFIGYVGLPSTVVPVGVVDGLPVGVQVVGPYLEDRTTLAFARLIEDLLGGYRPPPLVADRG